MPIMYYMCYVTIEQRRCRWPLGCPKTAPRQFLAAYFYQTVEMNMKGVNIKGCYFSARIVAGVAEPVGARLLWAWESVTRSWRGGAEGGQFRGMG
jgi:hypothetical protein